MINAIIGRPGSGKSYEATVFHILEAVRKGRRVVTNLPLNLDEFERVCPGSFGLIRIIPGGKLAFKKLDDYRDDWRDEKTNIGPLLVIDEAHHVFRGTVHPDLLAWFAEHRHEGKDVLLLTQTWRQVNAEVRDMVEICYRLSKARSLGLESRYVRKVQDGYRGEVTNTAIRKYEPRYFPLYQSHTRSNGAVLEASASDVRPIWKNWTVYGAAICAVIAVFMASRGGLNPFPKAKPKTQPVQSASVSGPAVHDDKPVPPVAAPLDPKLVKPEKKEELEPYGAVQLHIVAYLHSAHRSVYLFSASQNGQAMFEMPDRDLRSAGYEVRGLAPCSVELVYSGTRRYITCDSPTITASPGRNFQGQGQGDGRGGHGRPM